MPSSPVPKCLVRTYAQVTAHCSVVKNSNRLSIHLPMTSMSGPNGDAGRWVVAPQNLVRGQKLLTDRMGDLIAMGVWMPRSAADIFKG